MSGIGMRILVVGAGAVGGYFGARLLQAGRDVTFLVRPARAESIRKDGLRIRSPHGDATLQPELVTRDAIAAPFDIVLLGVKAYALDDAVADLAPAVGPETMIVPMLNGMRHLDVLAARFGERPVLGGVCRVATELDAEGAIRQLAGFQSLSYGERDGRPSPRIERLHGALRDAGFEAAVSSDIIREMWEKWVLLATLGGITCLLRGAIGEVAAVPGGKETALAILGECLAVADAWGQRPAEEFATRQSAALTTVGSPLTPSMYRDLRKGAPVEGEQIVGDFVARGAAKGVATPLLRAAAVNLAVYQAARSRGG